MRKSLKTLLSAAKSWQKDNAFKHSAAVSFYTLFSLAPITIIAISVAGFVFGPEAASGQLAEQIEQLVGSASAELIQKAVASSQPQHGNWFSTGLGIGLLVVGATTVFAQLQDSLNAIWGVTAKPTRNSIVVLLIQRLISFAMVLTVGFLLLVSLILTTTLATFTRFASDRFSIPPFLLQGVDLFVALSVITLLFAMMLKVLPDVVLRWKDVWRGAFIAALLFSVGRILIALYLSHSTVASTFGAAGSLVALLIWVYYSCAILFFGAEYTRAHRFDHGIPVQPKPSAVLIEREVAEVSPAEHKRSQKKKDS